MGQRPATRATRVDKNYRFARPLRRSGNGGLSEGVKRTLTGPRARRSAATRYKPLLDRAGDRPVPGHLLQARLKMKNDPRCARMIAAALLTCVALVGCVVAPGPAYYPGEYAAVAPPPPQGEVIGAAPAPGYLWIGGYWNWVGGRHVWVAGRWEAPRPGYRWVAHAWEHEARGWRMRPGH